MGGLATTADMRHAGAYPCHIRSLWLRCDRRVPGPSTCLVGCLDLRALARQYCPGMASYRIRIVYCPKCNWLLRSAWYAQELLQTFTGSITALELVPDQAQGGRFEVFVDEQLIWERKRDGGFPGIKELKQRVRDHIDPDRDLGHTDR